jgi:FlaA1/EpsC-like NDP-sugar epimerase
MCAWDELSAASPGIFQTSIVIGQRNDAFLKPDLAQRTDRLLLHILPYFVAFSVVVCYVCNLTTTKWRFISLPDALNILRVATILALALLVLDYIFVAPNVHGTFFLGKVTIVLYWFLEVFFLSAMRFAYVTSDIRGSAATPAPRTHRRPC